MSEQAKTEKKNVVTITITDTPDGKSVSVALDINPKPKSEEDLTNSVRLGIELMEYINVRSQMTEDESPSKIDAPKGIIVP